MENNQSRNSIILCFSFCASQLLLSLFQSRFLFGQVAAAVDLTFRIIRIVEPFTSDLILTYGLVNL